MLVRAIHQGYTTLGRASAGTGDLHRRIARCLLRAHLTITVPRKNTPTTSLEVIHPGDLGAQNSTAFVAFSWKKSAGSWTGGICWGKQKGASARLHSVVTEFTGRAVPGAPKERLIRARLAKLRYRVAAGAPKERFIRARRAKLPTKAQSGVNVSPGRPRYAGSGAG